MFFMLSALFGSEMDMKLGKKAHHEWGIAPYVALGALGGYIAFQFKWLKSKVKELFKK